MWLKLAARNLLRNRKRTILTLTGIVISVGILLLSEGMLAGIGNQMKNNLIDYQTAHFKVSLAGYQAEKDIAPLDYLLADPAAVMQAVSQVPGVVGVAPRLLFPARLSDGENELPTQGIGIDISGQDEQVFHLQDTLVAGRYLQPETDSLLLGENLARLFAVKVGQPITVVARTKYEALEALDLNVTGIVRTGNPSIDLNVFFVPLSVAQSLVEAPGEATEIAVRITPAAQKRLFTTAANLKQALPEAGVQAEVFSWEVLAAEYLRLHAIKQKGSLIILSLIVLITAVGITNTMVMVTFERTQEIGTMMAFGVRRTQILRVFLWEGALLGLIGSILGCLWGGAVTYYYQVHGINLVKLYGEMEIGYPIKDYMYMELTWPALLYTLIFGLTVSILASAFPSWRASRLKPATALRHT